MSNYHTPVMLNECIEGLNIIPEGKYVDVTFGGGGHSNKIFEKLEGGKLIAFDKDDDVSSNKIDNEKFIFIRQDFSYLKNFLRYLDILPVNGILADLGVSSHQIDTPKKGFSYRFNAELDMRMDSDATLTAKKILNEYPEEQLHKLFGIYGEVKNAKTLAHEIILFRKEIKFETTQDLVKIIEKCIKKNDKFNKYASQVFQALRIEVNDELGSLRKMLNQSVDVLATGGRLVVLTYHSLEDRLVKNFIKAGNFKGEIVKDIYGNSESYFKQINSKPIVPTDEEIRENPRSRSAKLRIAEKI